MAASRVLLRDGSNISDAFLQRVLALYSDIPFATPVGIGTGYKNGIIGKRNGAAGSDPNHFAIIATGTNRILTARPGWALVQQDDGSTTFDPRVLIAQSDQAMTATATANATGSTRNDTVCIKLDMNTTPNADGSNLLSLAIVAGASGGGISNAPADGNLYFPVANVAVANGATTLAQGNVTDLRYSGIAGAARGPLGMLGKVTATTGQGPITTSTNLTNMSITLTPYGPSRILKITLNVIVLNNTINGSIRLSIWKDGAEIGGGVSISATANQQLETVIVAYDDSPTVAAHTYIGKISNNTGAGSVSTSASAALPMVMTIEDCGSLPT